MSSSQPSPAPNNCEPDTKDQSGTPLTWRIAIFVSVLGLGSAAYCFRQTIGLRGQAAVGVFCFLGIAAAMSANLRRLNWRTLLWGIALQVLLAFFVIKFEVGGVRPGHDIFLWLTQAIKKFLDFTDKGARFVFGDLADPDSLAKIFGKKRSFVFAFSALPAIIFVSSFFSLLHHLGIIQKLVYITAKVMKYLMRTSGAETLAAVENVFMGQSEAPLIVRPYVPRMTRSELLALMTGGMATLSGGMIAVYIGMGVDAVALLATGVMSAPCSLYMTKLLVPETHVPETSGDARPVVERENVNALDAIASGASTGIKLAINIAAMLIAFLSFLALIDFLLGMACPSLSLQKIFSFVFGPVAFLMGVTGDDIPGVADLLGTKLVANEFVAYEKLTEQYRSGLGERARILTTYALAGFANFSSIGIQLGALGTMAPDRRHDFA